MIEPTDEMVEAYRAGQRQVLERITATGGAYDLDEVTRAGLAAVLAIVERDYEVLCGAVRPLDDSGIGALTCNGRLGHTGNHVHADGDWMVSW